MLFRLVVERKGRPTRSIAIRSSVACIGRAHGNDIRIPSSEVSRKHCELREKDGLVTIEDLESINGTYLNDDLITGVAVVRPGDRVEVGPITFVVEYELTPKALQQLRSKDYEMVDDDSAAIVIGEAEDDEPDAKPKATARQKPVVKEDKEESQDQEENDEMAEEPLTSLMDYDDVSWQPPETGDLHDLLSGLDHGAESMQPKKKPGPRKRVEDDEEAPKPAPDKGGKKQDGKRRPKSKE